jgi:hypothetical protein
MSVTGMSRLLLFYNGSMDLTIIKQWFVMIFIQACDKATTTANTEVEFRVTEMYLFNLLLLSPTKHLFPVSSHKMRRLQSQVF